MKKPSVLTPLRAFLVVWMAASLFAAAPAAAQYAFTDDFESGSFTPGGWLVTGATQISSQAPASGQYCAEGPATWGLAKTTPPITASQLTVDFSVKASQTNTSCLVFRIMDGVVHTASGLFFDEFGQIIGVNGQGAGGLVTLMAYTPNTWYAFHLELDMNAQTFDIYIDGNLVGNDFSFYSSGFTNAELFTWSSLAQSGSAWLDDISIGTGAVGIAQPASLHPSPWIGDPVNGQVEVATGMTGTFSLEMVDARGRSVCQRDFSGPGAQIGIPAIRPGIYVLLLRDEAGRLIDRKKVQVY